MTEIIGWKVFSWQMAFLSKLLAAHRYTHHTHSSVCECVCVTQRALPLSTALAGFPARREARGGGDNMYIDHLMVI